MSTKECRKCFVHKDVTDFYPSKRHSDRLHPWCKPCTLAYNRAYIKKNPEANAARARKSRVRYTYGITWQQREALIARYDGTCWICRKPFPNTKGTHTDHDPLCGEVRGMLCLPCNAVLGRFKDDLESLKRAMLYLEAHESRCHAKQASSHD